MVVSPPSVPLMKVVECEVPPTSELGSEFIESADFVNGYRVPLGHGDANVIDVFFAIFGHYPMWIKAILMARNRLASWCGLDAASASELRHFQNKKHYRVGDKIGVWPIFTLTPSELIAGRDNKHLDFRLSLLKSANSEPDSVTVSTVCKVHNTFGKIYLACVIPFHQWGIQRLISQAIRAGRL